MKQLILITFLFGVLASNAQDPTRFDGQIEQLSNKEYNFGNNKKLVVFTGSSSIKRWTSVESDFSAYNVINHGFGGSQFSDLLYFYNELILRQKPNILFIYEGDNDIAAGKKPSKVFRQAKELVEKINEDLPDTRVILISPKPCLANWKKKNKYIKLNKKLENYCMQQNNVEFADVWKKMVDKNGVVFQNIFVEDGDHMNAKGYTIWVEVIGEFL